MHSCLCVCPCLSVLWPCLFAFLQSLYPSFCLQLCLLYVYHHYYISQVSLMLVVDCHLTLTSSLRVLDRVKRPWLHMTSLRSITSNLPNLTVLNVVCRWNGVTEIVSSCSLLTRLAHLLKTVIAMLAVDKISMQSFSPRIYLIRFADCHPVL